MMLWQGLYSQLTAIEAIGVGRQGPHLNDRGARLLHYLRARACCTTSGRGAGG